MYYTVIKHSDHLRTLDKCRKHSPAARVFYISLVFSNARRVLSQCNTRLRLLYLLNRNTVLNQSACVFALGYFLKYDVTRRFEGPVHTTPEEFENKVSLWRKTHQIISVNYNGGINNHFGFVFEENSVREIT